MSSISRLHLCLHVVLWYACLCFVHPVELGFILVKNKCMADPPTAQDSMQRAAWRMVGMKSPPPPNTTPAPPHTLTLIKAELLDRTGGEVSMMYPK